jgi:hypothetical protein
LIDLKNENPNTTSIWITARSKVEWLV